MAGFDNAPSLDSAPASASSSSSASFAVSWCLDGSPLSSYWLLSFLVFFSVSSEPSSSIPKQFTSPHKQNSQHSVQQLTDMPLSLMNSERTLSMLTPVARRLLFTSRLGRTRLGRLHRRSAVLPTPVRMTAAGSTVRTLTARRMVAVCRRAAGLFVACRYALAELVELRHQLVDRLELVAGMLLRIQFLSCGVIRIQHQKCKEGLECVSGPA